MFNDIAVDCLVLGQRKGKPEAEAARLAKRGQVAYNSQYNYVQSSDYVIQASFRGHVLMTTKLIRLQDGTLVEVEVSPGEAQQIAGGSMAKRVDSTFEKIKPTLINACRPIADVWQELSKDMHISQAEVEIGLSFAIEGDIYIAKSKADANLKVKLTLKPKEVTEDSTVNSKE